MAEKNQENIKIYGQEIFGDNYNMIKNNPDKWIYGDGTGDVTKNIKFYSEKYSNSIDLVSSDCGLGESVFGVQEKTMLNIESMVESLKVLGVYKGSHLPINN